MSIAAAVLALAATAFPTASVYKCKQADGSIAFQQAPCAATAEALGQETYERQPDVPHQQYVPSRDGPEARKRAEQAAAMEDQVQAMHMAAQNGLFKVPPPEAGPVANAYSCSDGAKTWMQQAPCPRSVMALKIVPVTQATGPRGEWVNGSAVVPQETMVRQTPMTSEEVCRRINSNTATQHKEQRASDASYERNKLRNQNGC